MNSAEEAVLIAVLDDDMATAQRLLRDFHPRELREFQNATELLTNLIHEERHAPERGMR